MRFLFDKDPAKPLLSSYWKQGLLTQSASQTHALTGRQRNAIEELLVKERLDLPLPLRQLDAAIEKVGLALRRAVSAALDEDATPLPPHVVQKIDERLQLDLRNNPAMDSGPDLEKARVRRPPVAAGHGAPTPVRPVGVE